MEGMEVGWPAGWPACESSLPSHLPTVFLAPLLFLGVEGRSLAVEHPLAAGGARRPGSRLCLGSHIPLRRALESWPAPESGRPPCPELWGPLHVADPRGLCSCVLGVGWGEQRLHVGIWTAACVPGTCHSCALGASRGPPPPGTFLLSPWASHPLCPSKSPLEREKQHLP